MVMQLKVYKIWKFINGVKTHVRNVAAASAWDVKLNGGEWVYGNRDEVITREDRLN